MQNYTLSQIAELLGAELQGDGALEITKIATLANARTGHIAFLANSKYRVQLEATLTYTAANQSLRSNNEAFEISCPIGYST